jgi:mono/diheme cytochrome c family protein
MGLAVAHGDALMMKPGNTSTDRLWFWFAVSSGVFFVVLAISPVKDYFREYRHYQNTYRSLLTRTAGSQKELREANKQTVGIHQIWLPAFNNRVDRCVTCHLGVDEPRMAKAAEPFRQHPRTPHTPGDTQRFGCVICHQGQGRATSLAEAHGNVADWSSPLLPVRYTEASCGRCHLGDDVPEAALLSEGRALITRIGCYGCHKVAGQEKWRSEAPDLAGLSLKTNPAWLKAWLHAPRSLRPATWMPDFALQPGEIDSLLAFLWTRRPLANVDSIAALVPGGGDPDHGKVIFSASRCISCHTVEGRGNGSAPELSGIGSKVKRNWLVAYLGDPARFYPGTRMPRYHFSGADLADLSAYMLQEFTDSSAPEPSADIHPAEKTIAAGNETYRRFGCGGCHRIGGENVAAQIGPELTGIADKPAALLDFGKRDQLPRRLPEWLAAKVNDPRSFRDGLRMPRFGFTEHQTEAVVTALLALGREPVPAPYAVPAPQHEYVPPGHFGALVAEYRCMSCHQIGGVGGDISTAPLTAEGSKVRETWLAGYLGVPTTLRPILEERMIVLQIPKDQAAFIANFADNVLRDDRIPDDMFPNGPRPDQVERGRKLYHERYGCQACHMIGGKGGYYGPLLDGAGNRLKSGWIYTWLKGPQKWRADVREPDYGLDDADALDLTAFVATIPPPAAPGSTAPSSGSGKKKGGGQ